MLRRRHPRSHIHVTRHIHAASGLRLCAVWILQCILLRSGGQAVAERLGEDTKIFRFIPCRLALGYSGGVILAGAIIPRQGTAALSHLHYLLGAVRIHVAADAGKRRCRKAHQAKVPLKQLFTSRQAVYIYALWCCGASAKRVRSHMLPLPIGSRFSTEYTSTLITIACLASALRIHSCLHCRSVSSLKTWSCSVSLFSAAHSVPHLYRSQ